jgi:hypothetical protein
LLAADRAAEALGPLVEGLLIISPLAERLPAAHRESTMRLALRLLQAAAAAGVDPDSDLLARVRSIYGDDAV